MLSNFPFHIVGVLKIGNGCTENPLECGTFSGFEHFTPSIPPDGGGINYQPYALFHVFLKTGNKSSFMAA